VRQREIDDSSNCRSHQRRGGTVDYQHHCANTTIDYRRAGVDDTTLDNGSSTSPKAVAAHDHSDAETALAPHVLLSSAAAVRAYALHNQDWLRHVLATYDSLTPGILRAQELASMATLARTLTGPSALTGLREAMQAHLQAEQLVLS
jgi:hypothetical protein